MHSFKRAFDNNFIETDIYFARKENQYFRISSLTLERVLSFAKN